MDKYNKWLKVLPCKKLAITLFRIGNIICVYELDVNKNNVVYDMI